MKPKYSGFGLVELMISISIMTVIMAIVIARHDRFNGAVLLRSQAYEIALDLREIQLSAVSATSLGGEYRSDIGVHFAVSQPNSYVLFQDGTNGTDYYYDAGEQLGVPSSIDSRFEIRSIKRSDTNADISPLSISFARPDFDARFTTSSGNNLDVPSVIIELGRVGVSGTAEDVARYIEIGQTGQIVVKVHSEL